ncbi:MAG: Dabb family protein, partial [Verrucomicrobiota bacterium]
EGGLASLYKIDVVQSGRFAKAALTPERPVTHNTFDYSLFLEFPDVAAHNAYQVHPEHDAFVEQFKDWFGEVRVFDSTILS